MTVHISVRHYTALLLLSLLTVQLSDFFARSPHFAILVLGCAPPCGFIIWITTQFGPPGIPTSPPYCIATAYVLLYLYEGATAIEKYATSLGSNFSRTQHSVVHFGLAFFVLSELEFYRQYIAFRGIQDWRTALRELPWANYDRTFAVTRDPLGYILSVPRDANTKDAGSALIWLRSNHFRIFMLTTLLFYPIGGCFNYPLKRIVNPSLDAEGERFVDLLSNANILYNETVVFSVFLHFLRFSC
ncbi:hypothetical protein BDW02DRAFT_598347 [Decorospora gaudefroyi]|uniref:Wax synthase domain-containing protein n=1 Tax=Decorospora gaudefroyi TaxID=184978 RepID=A0A6A5KFY1_9PLEO|nr:hypothetical protein BDW02DRAFT_598347 [Decorospora gaudefroyi]